MKTDKNEGKMLKSFVNRLFDNKDLDDEEFGDYFGVTPEKINNSSNKEKIVKTKKET